jgi:hypothetical protein
MRLAMLRNILRRGRRWGRRTSLHRRQTTGCKKWLITNLGTASRNTNIHPFVGPEKGIEKSEAPHINKESLPLCCFSQKFFSSAVTGRRILPAT